MQILLFSVHFVASWNPAPLWWRCLNCEIKVCGCDLTSLLNCSFHFFYRGNDSFSIGSQELLRNLFWYLITNFNCEFSVSVSKETVFGEALTCSWSLKNDSDTGFGEYHGSQEACFLSEWRQKSSGWGWG